MSQYCTHSQKWSKWYRVATTIEERSLSFIDCKYRSFSNLGTVLIIAEVESVAFDTMGMLGIKTDMLWVEICIEA
jgi:hypothetical protein